MQELQIFLIFLVVQLADRHLIGNALFRFFLIYFFHIFSALNPSPDLGMTSHLKARCKTGVSAPADTGNIIRLSIRAVDCYQQVRNLSSQRRFSVNRRFTYVTIQLNLICLCIFYLILQKFHLPGKNRQHQPVFLLFVSVVGTELTGNPDIFSGIIFSHID